MRNPVRMAGAVHPRAVRPPHDTVFGEHRTCIVHTEHVCITDDGQSLALGRRYHPDAGSDAPPVLLVHGLAQNRHAWELPDRSLPNYLVDRGFDVWTLELRGHGRSRVHGSRCARGITDYADRDVPAAIDHIQRQTRGRRILYVGHSLGGCIGMWQQPRQHSRLAGLVALGSPIDLGRDAPSLKALCWTWRMLDRATPICALPGATAPTRLVGGLNRTVLGWLDQPRSPFPLALWAPGSIERKALVHLVTHAFDHTGFGIIRFITDWVTHGRPIDAHAGEDLGRRYDAFGRPVLLAIGNRDPIVPEAAAATCRQRLASDDLQFEVHGDADWHCGHYDIVVGDRAYERIWPRVADWLSERSQRT